MEGHALRRRLQVVLGHSPLEALVEMLVGLVSAQFIFAAL